MKNPSKLVALSKELEELKNFRVALYKGNFLKMTTGQIDKSHAGIDTTPWMGNIKLQLLTDLDERMDEVKAQIKGLLEDD